MTWLGRLKAWIKPPRCPRCGGKLRFSGVEMGWGAGTDQWTCETCEHVEPAETP